MGIPARVLWRVAGGKASGGLSRRGTKRAFQEPSQALLHYGGPALPEPSEDAQGWAEVGGDAQTQGSGAGPCREWSGKFRQRKGAQVKVSHAAGWGLGGHNLFLASPKSKCPTREDVCEEQEILNPIKREK